MDPEIERQELKTIVLENQKLLAEINERLKKQEQKQRRDFWIKTIWTIVFFVAPLVIFYWYLAPLYSSFSGTSGSLNDSLHQLNQLQILLQK